MEEYEEISIDAIKKKGSKIKRYHNYEKNNFVVGEDIIGFDANVLVDMVDDAGFRREIKDEVTFNVLDIFTTEIALGEARHVLIKKRKYSFDSATDELKNILKDFSIKKIIHNNESDNLGDKWVDIVKKRMYIKKFHTFPNDCKILANLVNQAHINTYYTEDKDIKEAVNLLSLKVRIRIMPSADNLSNAKIKDFFNQMRKNPYRKRKPS